MGTIVERLAPGICEVEFSDPSGRAYASVAVRADQMLELYREPRQQWALGVLGVMTLSRRVQFLVSETPLRLVVCRQGYMGPLAT